jgi:hypothetical protein
MKPANSLQLSALAFSVFWFSGMLWTSGANDFPTIFTLALSSAVTGYVWYRLMHWSFRRMHLLPFEGAGAA